MGTENLFENMMNESKEEEARKETPMPSPSSLVPKAPLEGQKPAPENVSKVLEGQPTTNPVSSIIQENLAEASHEDNSDEEEETSPPVGMDELSMLKSRARLMGITFSNNISKETLKEKINAKLNADTNQDQETDVDEDEIEDEEQIEEPVIEEKTSNKMSNITSTAPEKVVAKPVSAEKKKKVNLRQHMIDTEMRLVRLRITNLDPKKKDLPGEILTIANEHLGTVRKFIPYGEVTDNGWHVPYCLFKQLRDRQFLSITTTKGPRGPVPKTQWAKEFALEILDPLTPEELARLAAAQIGAGNIDN